MNDAPTQSTPVGTYLVLAVVICFFIATLLNLQPPAGGGEARIANAYLVLYLSLGLWLSLALLLVTCAVMGEMPRWAALSFILLHLIAGAGMVAAIDMAERKGWALIFVVLLPVLEALYALWARLPSLRAKYPAQQTSLAMLGAILFLSVAALLAAM